METLQKEISGLNERQKEAVFKTEGPLMVIAGAGSGKTRVITLRAAHIISQGNNPKSVLAVTFTNKAAKEMNDRIVTLLKTKKRNTPVISTFHSLCLKILRYDINYLGYNNNFTIYDTSDQLSLVRTLLHETRMYDKSFKVDEVLSEIAQKKVFNATGKHSKDFKKNLYSKNTALEIITETVFPKYERALKALNAVDFDDLLLLSLKLFKEFPDVLKKYQNKYRYIMVDEYQDTNDIQYTLIKMLCKAHKNICVVGDDDQSIYSWRGANLDNIINFQKDFEDVKIVKLEQNYRSLGNILTAANGLIENNKKRMGKNLWTNDAPGAKVGIFRAEDGEGEAKWITKRITICKYERKIEYNDFAIIYRANSFSKPIEEELRANGMPYQVIGGTSYFERKEVKDLSSYLRVISNNSDDLSLARIINTPRRGIGISSIELISQHAKEKGISLFNAISKPDNIEGLNASANKSCKSLFDLISRYMEAFSSHKDMSNTFTNLIFELEYKDYIYSLYKTPKASIKRIENIDSFIDSLMFYEENEDEENPTLKAFLERLALTDILKKDEKKDINGITLSSFHSAKGLEFPVVFIAGVEEDIIPHKKSVLFPDDVEEERRLFYVGITRAMRELYITNTESRISYGKPRASLPSRFLEELPDEVIERLDNNHSDNEESTDEDFKNFFNNISDIISSGKKPPLK